MAIKDKEAISLALGSLAIGLPIVVITGGLILFSAIMLSKQQTEFNKERTQRLIKLSVEPLEKE